MSGCEKGDPLAATLKSRLPQIAASLRPRVSAGVKVGAGRVAAAAEERAPELEAATSERDPGELRDSIKVVRRAGAAYTVQVTAQDDHGLYWGWFQEFGRVGQAAQPFLVPALEAERDAVTADVAASLHEL